MNASQMTRPLVLVSVNRYGSCTLQVSLNLAGTKDIKAKIIKLILMSTAAADEGTLTEHFITKRVDRFFSDDDRANDHWFYNGDDLISLSVLDAAKTNMNVVYL